MTAQPHLPETPLTVAAFEALGEDDDRLRVRYELQEGSIVVSPSPTPDHSVAMFHLAQSIAPELPEDVELLLDIDLDLELAPANRPGFVRRPDLMVTHQAARRRVRASGGIIRASDVVLVVEIVSPGSRRMDNVIKRGEYADAGIPYYWIIDLNPPVSLVSCHRAGEFGYQDSGVVTGEFHATEPFDVRIDLTKLG